VRIGITCHPTHGGSGVVASEIALGLAERGHDVHVVSYATPFRLRSYHQNVTVHEVEVSTYPLFKYPPYALALATKLVDVATHYGLQFIHAHYAVPHATSAHLAKEMLADRFIRTITTLHGTDITLVGLDPSFFRVVQFTIESSDAVTTPSEYLRRRTAAEFGIRRAIRVIPNPVNTQRFQKNDEDCTREHFAPRGERILLHASNFRPLKRSGDAVRILEIVRRTIPARLVMVGDGPERTGAQELARSLGIENDVLFLGEVDLIERVMSCADLFLLPSDEESFGLAALEALACEVPVVASRVGGLPELVEEGKSGFLLPAGDVEAMAEKAIGLLKDPAQYKMMSEAARVRAEAFDTRIIVPQYEALYEELLGGKAET
jgi:L-malate glycosyltransferase